MWACWLKQWKRQLAGSLNAALPLPCAAAAASPACSKSEQINSDPNSALGSLPYTAPEVLSNTMRHGHQADVWSLGVALYKMCVGLYPFERVGDATDTRTTVQVCGGCMLRACVPACPSLPAR